MILSFALCVLISLAFLMLSDLVAMVFSPLFFDSSILYHIGASYLVQKNGLDRVGKMGVKLHHTF